MKKSVMLILGATLSATLLVNTVAIPAVNTINSVSADELVVNSNENNVDDNQEFETQGLKTWLIKEALTQAAKFAGKAATGTYIEKTMLSLAGAFDQGEARAKQIISDGLVNYLGVSRSTANTAAGLAVTILL